MIEQRFEIVPPGKLATLFTVFIGAVLPMIILVLMVASAKGSREWLTAAPAVVILPLVAAVLAWSMHRRAVTLSDAGLTVRRLPWPKFVARSELDLEQARIIDLDEHPQLKPMLRIAGTGLPGYRAGWFWLRDRRRAYLLLTDTRRVLLLPRHDGQLFLLSLQRPEALLDALRQSAR